MTYLITGATGLIGSNLTKFLINRGDQVIAYVRNPQKASTMPALKDANIITQLTAEHRPDYIVHTAAPTDSQFMVSHPLETINAIVDGSREILEFARLVRAKFTVLLSSMEVYGYFINEIDLTEDIQGYIDPAQPRSSYPLAKRLMENMGVAYNKEYGVPVASLRLANTIASNPDDKRLVSYILRTIKSGKPIELATDGGSKLSYVSIADVISAILTPLKPGESYNVAGDYASVKELAELANSLFNGKGVVTNTGDQSKYPPNTYLKLNCNKLKSIGQGWKPQVDLKAMLQDAYLSL